MLRRALSAFDRETVRGRGASLALAGVSPRPRAVGRRTLATALQPARPARPRSRRAHRASARPRPARPRAASSPATGRRGASLVEESAGRHRGDREPARTVRRPVPRRLPGPRSRAIRADRASRQESGPPGRGNRDRPSPSGRARCSTTASAAMTDALAAAEQASEYLADLSPPANWGLVELIEAAARCGSARDARRRSAAALGVHQCQRHRLGARGRGALAGAAERGRGRRPLYREAIERLGRTGCVRIWPARTCSTANGCAAKTAGSTPASSFAPPTRCSPRWAWRLRRTRPRRAPGHRRNACANARVETRDDLTAQEAQIARLARDGAPTKRSAAQLFISPRTVEWHLGNVFTKFGITSRKDLR